MPPGQNPGQNSETKLQYFIAEQGPVQIVSFVGNFTRQHEPVLLACVRDVMGRNAAWVVLNFRDVVAEVDRKMFRALVQAQKTLREKPKLIRICGMHPDLAFQLIEQGVVRREELFANVAEVLSSIKQS